MVNAHLYIIHASFDAGGRHFTALWGLLCTAQQTPKIHDVKQCCVACYGCHEVCHSHYIYNTKSLNSERRNLNSVAISIVTNVR